MEELIKLSKKEIGDAIVNYIALQKGKLFFPYYIYGTDVNLNIPATVTFKLEAIMKGSRTDEVKHNI